MRPVPAVLLLSLALLAGCGSDDEPSGSTLFGGFAPRDGTAVLFAPATCTLPFVGTTSVSAVAIGLTSGADACALLTATRFCGTESGSTGVIAVALAGQVGGGTIEAAGPGTYPFLADPPTGPFHASTADAAKVDAVCEPDAGSPLDMTGGRIVLTTVGAERVAGTLSLRFEDRSSLEHPFDVAVCPLTVDVCSLFQPCFDYACVLP